MYNLLSIPSAVPHLTLLCKEIERAGLTPHFFWSVLKYSIHWPEHWICIDPFVKLMEWNVRLYYTLTLIASVWIAATTSSELPRTQLFGSVGSNSQIAVVISMFAILVMAAIMSTTARLRTCASQGKHCQKGLKLKMLREWRRRSTVLHAVSLLLVLSAVIQES